MQKSDKLIVIVGVIILITASIGIYTWVPEEEELDMPSVHEISGVFAEVPTAIKVSDSNPFYALIATPLAIHYDENEEQEVIPLYVENLTSPSRAIQRAQESIGRPIDLVIDDSKSPEEWSLALADKYWKESNAAMLIENSQEGYNFGVVAAPLASYLSLPIIVTDSVDVEISSFLKKLGVKYSLICGNLSGFDSKLKFETVDDIVNATSEIVQEKFKEVEYITLANPLDITDAKVIETTSERINGTLSSLAITPSHFVSGILGIVRGIPLMPSYTFNISEDYKYARVKIDARSLVDEDPEETGTALGIQFRDPDGTQIGFLSTSGGIPVRSPDRKKIVEDRIHWDTIIYDQPGTYTISLTGTYLTSKTGKFEIDITIENLESPLVPAMKKLSSIAPYLTAYRKGIIIARPEFAFVADENIIPDPSPGVVYPASNSGLIEDVNKHVFKIHESINERLAKFEGIELIDEEDLELLQNIYDEEPIYIAIVGDATMIPQYYYYDTPDANRYDYGWNVAGDHIYGNIDPIPRNDKISVLASDEKTTYPYQENIVGRITGWDAQDASALIVRTIFYNDVLENYPIEDWKKTATVQSGCGTDVQRLPFVDLIRRVFGLEGEELPIKWPTGAAHFENMMISEVIETGGFDVRSTESLESMRKGFSGETIDIINKIGLLNRFLFPKSLLNRVASEDKIKGGANQQESNFIFSFGHGQPMHYSHGDVYIDSMGFRPVIVQQLLNRWFLHAPLPISLGSGLSKLGAYAVRFVENMDLGPSVMMIESCYTGRIDGFPAQNCVCQAYLHAGLNALIASSRGSPGPGYLDARPSPVGIGLREYLKTRRNPDIQDPHFSALHAVNIFEDLIINDYDIGTAFRNAKNKFLPMDANSTFFWTPPLALSIETTQDLEYLNNNFRQTSDEEDAKVLEKKYTCLFEYNLFGDPAFNPYEPRNAY